MYYICIVCIYMKTKMIEHINDLLYNEMWVVEEWVELFCRIILPKYFLFFITKIDPDSLIKQGFQKALSKPQKDLRKPERSSNENILPFITTFNPNNPNIYSAIKSSVNCLKMIMLAVFIISN